MNCNKNLPNETNKTMVDGVYVCLVIHIDFSCNMNDSRPCLVAEANIFSWHAQPMMHLEVMKQAWAVS